MGTTTATAIVPAWLSPWLASFPVWRLPVTDAEVEDIVDDVELGDGVDVEVCWTVTVDVDEGAVDVSELEEAVVEGVVVLLVVVDELEVVVGVDELVFRSEVDEGVDDGTDEVGLVGVLWVVVADVGSAGVVGVG
jgi:hypothetical protein